MMRRREALTLIAGTLFSTGLVSAALAKPGNGNGKGHGGGNGGGSTGTGGGPGKGGKKPKNVVLNGSVKELDAGGFTLHVNGHGPGGYDVAVTVSADTTFVKGQAPIDPATVNVGALVQVRGALDTDTQTLAATQVKLKKPGKDDGGGDTGTGGTSVSGSVVSTNTTGFVVHPPAVAGVQPPDVSVTVTGTTTFTKPDNTAGSMADVAVGAQVTVQGTVDPASNSLVATTVAVTAAAPPPPGP